MTNDGISKVDVHIHYLKVLKGDSSIMQPEIRDAIDYAIKMLSIIKE